MNFEDDWENAKVINLVKNYRSTKDIVDRANGFIKRYYGDYEHYADAIPHTKKTGSIKVEKYYNAEEEAMNVIRKIEELIASGTKLNDIAVLYRLNVNADYIENELKKRDIPYDIDNNSSFFKRKEISGILACLRLILDPHDNSAFDTLLKMRSYPVTFMKNTVFDSVRNYAMDHDVSYFDSVKNG